MDAVVSNSREMIRKGSRSFALASRLFDTTTRDHAWLLYAWCRHCDDQIDGQDLGMTPGPGSRRPGMEDEAASLARLRTETLRALAGEDVTEPAFQAFQRVVREHDIPARYALELLAGFEMDVTRHGYRTFDDTLLYCYRVAGVVGVMMALIMGVGDREALRRAADLGIAFQLTNISRDVLDDAWNGRCYLPAEWLAGTGISATGITDPKNRRAVAVLVERLLREADRYYESAGIGLRSLSFRSAWAVATALGIYRDIGRVVRQRGSRAWDTRAVVGAPRKLVLLAGGAVRALRAVTWDRWRRRAPRNEDLWNAPDVNSGDHVTGR